MNEINKNASFVATDIVPHIFYQVYGKNQKWMHDTEVVYYSFDAGTYKESEEEKEIGCSTITISPAIIDREKNKYVASGAVSVTVTVGEKLKEFYPLAIVTIDGKNYDLAVLNNAIAFNMDVNHRISINWIAGELVETFRICPNR